MHGLDAGPQDSGVPDVESVCSLLQGSQVTRGYVVRRDGHFEASHPALAPLDRVLGTSPSFAGHEAVFIGREEGIPTIFCVFVHDTRRGLAQGGLRLKPYRDLAGLVNDGLRLSQGMTRKNALADLWWGGGKAIIPVTRELGRHGYCTRGSARRRKLLRSFGRFVASLNGIYYTAEDVGTDTEDMNEILAVNRFITCIGSELGGSGNPSPHTARGVFSAIQVASKFQGWESGLRDVRVAVQGAGNVGWPLICALHEAGARLSVADADPRALKRVRKLSSDIHVVEEAETIYDVAAEIFVPCAVGATVNSRTIPRLRRSGVRLICGAANNVLERNEDADKLAELEILFVPDFVCNRLGIVNCANEPFGYLLEDIDRAVSQVGPSVLDILRSARRRGITPLAEANERADHKAADLHPLWPDHRGRRLIEQLIRSDWASPQQVAGVEAA